MENLSINLKKDKKSCPVNVAVLVEVLHDQVAERVGDNHDGPVPVPPVRAFDQGPEADKEVGEFD
jgi:hypothetical protein